MILLQTVEMGIVFRKNKETNPNMKPPELYWRFFHAYVERSISQEVLFSYHFWPAGRQSGNRRGSNLVIKSIAEKGNRMKREFLQNFKVGDQPLPKEVIDAIMEENGHDIESVKSRFADYDALKEQLAAANKTIKDFKGMDIDGVKRAADEWKAKAEQAEKAAAARIADMEFDSDLKDAVAASRGRNAKAIRALLDVDTLKLSKNRRGISKKPWKA